jgi:hypothetical protein
LSKRSVHVRSAEGALVPTEKSLIEDVGENHDHLMCDAISMAVSPRHRQWLRWTDRYKILPDAAASGSA